MPSLFRLILIQVLFAIVMVSCNSRTGKSFVPSMPEYPEKLRQVFVLRDEVLEISGMTFLAEDRVAAINDEKGEIFFYDLKTDSIISYRFGGKGDYEELVRVDSTFYVLESKGIISVIPPPYKRSTSYELKIKGKIEFESMVYNKKLNKLIVITKEQKKNRTGITAFSFDLGTRQFDKSPFFEITYKEIFIKLENYNAECKPSAAAINPVTHNLYIVASIGKLIMECTLDGKLLKIYKLNPTHFPQPEGITFANNGDMYISNEGLDGKATILKYPYVAEKN